MTNKDFNERLDKLLDSQFTWLVPPNDTGKWESYHKRKALAKASLIALVDEVIDEITKGYAAVDDLGHVAYAGQQRLLETQQYRAKDIIHGK